MDTKITPKTIDEYIAGFPQDVQLILQKMRQVIHETAPGATEKISYQIPCFALNGDLVWFAGYRQHIGFYPKGSGIKAFQKELVGYKTAKGTVQFPLDKPIPYDLVRKIVKYRVEENSKKSG